MSRDLDEPLPERTRLAHTPPAWVRDDALFFITVNCAERHANSLCHAPIAEGVFGAVHFYNESYKWSCRLMLLMPDHLHAIIAFPPEPGMKTTMTRWKGYLAKKLGISWQQDFFDHRLRDHWQLIEKTSYILNNPVRRGLCAKPEDWRFVMRQKKSLAD
jgi:REP element-mobilizing transposase RayT